MGGRDHSCEGCGRGGFNDPDGECECPTREDPTAQDVIDALRLALVAQRDPEEMVRIVQALVAMAPETDGNRGIGLLLEMISEGVLKVAIT